MLRMETAGIVYKVMTAKSLLVMKVRTGKIRPISSLVARQEGAGVLFLTRKELYIGCGHGNIEKAT